MDLQIKKIEKLEINSGDILVVEVDYDISDEAAGEMIARVNEYVLEYLGLKNSVRVVVMNNGHKIKVISDGSKK